MVDQAEIRIDDDGVLWLVDPEGCVFVSVCCCKLEDGVATQC